MLKSWKFWTLIFTLLSVFLWGCSKRNNPVNSDIPHGSISFATFQATSLVGNQFNDPVVRTAAVYLPPGYKGVLGRLRYPTLYLLHGVAGDERTFSQIYNVGNVADELLARGEIQPMIIVMPDGSNLLEGSFYVNSAVQGDYENYITQNLLNHIDSAYAVYKSDPAKKTDRAFRAISGLDMGSFGAFSVAMNNENLFSSVSAIAGIFDMRGDSITGSRFSWMDTIMAEVFRENGITFGDIAGYKLISPSSSRPLTQMVFAMAGAFSPHDPADLDSSTFFSTIFGPGIDLPFDAYGQIRLPIFSKWLTFDLKKRLSGVQSGALDSIAVYLECSKDDRFFITQARAFHQFLIISDEKEDHDYVEYSGYAGSPAGHKNFLYDRWVHILKWHSSKFPSP